MNIEDNVFKRSIVDLDRLLKYGFKKEKDKYIYSTKILNNTFKVIVEVDRSSKTKGKIIDLSFGEEYTNFRVENITGEFVNKVREEFENVLLDIRNNCFNQKYFIFDQTNRITELIINEYNNKPEFLWDSTPGCGVFRNSSNNKWYGIIMNVSRGKLDKGSDEVEVLNIKLDKDKIVKLLLKEGYYPAYHMNKKYWISIILDDTLSDEEIFLCIKESYELIK